MHAARPSPAAPRISPVQLAAIVAAATALALLTTAQAGIAIAYQGEAAPWVGLLKARLVDWYACALFMPALMWLVRRYPIRRDSWQHHLPLLLLAAVPIAIAKESIFVAVGEIFRPGVFDLATILSEDLSHEVMAVWGLTAVAHLLLSLEPASHAARTRTGSIGTIQVRTRNGPTEVRIADIEYVDAQGNYARLVTPTGRYLLRETMARLEQRLGRDFIRVHRSLMVQRHKVAWVEPQANGSYSLRLESGARLKSGRSYRSAILASELPGVKA
jgi:two-component system LytT family response regulator